MIRCASLLLLPIIVLGILSREDDLLRQATSLSEEVQRLAGQETYWPGFDPAHIPLAIFDGTRTYLFRHPAPPEGFVEESGTYVFQGRHPSVVANSSAPIGGIPTATIMAGSFPDTLALRERAGVAIHEAFHVFQATSGRHWGANEADLFLYPIDDADLLALSRLEVDALRRAISTHDRNETTAWARVAMQLRQERLGRLEPHFSAYERETEAHEGTAAYVQHRVCGGESRDFLDAGFKADDVRNRAYWTGVALALLLDQFCPNWTTGFAKDDSRFLDSDLTKALATMPDAPARNFTELERSEIARRARDDVAAMIERRTTERKRFLSRPGWRLVFEAEGGHLFWPKGFDPLNIERVDDGTLHTRFLQVGNEDGTVEVMGCTALTEGVGPHPLFNGIRRIVLTGLTDKPQIRSERDHLKVTTPTCRAELTGAVSSESDSTVVIKLAGTKGRDN